MVGWYGMGGVRYEGYCLMVTLFFSFLFLWCCLNTIVFFLLLSWEGRRSPEFGVFFGHWVFESWVVIIKDQWK